MNRSNEYSDAYGLKLRKEWRVQALRDLEERTRQLVSANRLTVAQKTSIKEAFVDAWEDLDLVVIHTRRAIRESKLPVAETLYLESTLEQIRNEKPPLTWEECEQEQRRQQTLSSIPHLNPHSDFGMRPGALRV